MTRSNIIPIEQYQDKKLTPRGEALFNIRSLIRDNCDSITDLLDFLDDNPESIDALPPKFAGVPFGAIEILDTNMCEIQESLWYLSKIMETVSLDTAKENNLLDQTRDFFIQQEKIRGLNESS